MAIDIEQIYFDGAVMLEAVQYDGDNVNEIIEWIRRHGRDALSAVPFKVPVRDKFQAVKLMDYVVIAVGSKAMTVWNPVSFYATYLDKKRAANTIGLDELPAGVSSYTIRWLIEHGYAIDKIDERPQYTKMVIINHDTIFPFIGETINNFNTNIEIIANAEKRYEGMNGVGSVFDTELKEVPWDGHFTLKGDDHGDQETLKEDDVY